MGSSYSFPEVDIQPDRTYVITGGNTGIGFVTAKKIAMMGGHVIIACRNVEKGAAALKQMQEEYEKEFRERQAKEQKTGTEPIKLNLEQMELDLASFAKTMKFIEDFKERGCKLNVLICNAGLVMTKRVMTEDGYETDLQANYLSHLLIILHFLPLLQSSGEDSRIVQVSSMAHTWGKFKLSNINADESFGQMSTYGNSKLYQIMSMYWLNRHLKNQSVSIISLHPGFVRTQLSQGIGYLRIASKFTSINAVDGAATSIKAATDPSLKGRTGIYLSECKQKSTSSYSTHIDVQDQLMTYSLQALEKYLPADVNDYIDV